MPAVRRVVWPALWLSLIALPHPSASAAPSRELLVVVVHPSRPVRSLSRAHLAALFKRKKVRWRDGSRVLVVNAPPRSAARSSFDRQLLGLSPERAAAYWVDYRIRGFGRPPLSVASARMRVRLVEKQPGAIAYVPSSALGDGRVKVLRIGGHAPGAASYPLSIALPGGARRGR